jgi:cytochrome c-type biogenesis protein CcmF
MKYIGEHLLPGQLGYFFLVLSFVASLIATWSYVRSTQSVSPDDAASWKRIARGAFILEAFSVVAVFVLIYYIIYSHYFEYYYAWNHSDRSLSTKYLLSSIWEGQEGSFLLWSFWHCVLGLILMRTARQWEAPVMSVISFAQFCLATMIIGVYVFNFKIGSNPFLLTRHNFPDLPVFNRADYLTLPRFQDGNGLNQLLQNYWMVIHPPMLFLGFASTIVPFSFAIAGLWKDDHKSWIRVSLPWSLFSGAVLGLGIMMGAKWAYESLNFGGYWAWDPVENASLVPWLVLVAGIHTHLVYNATGHSLRTTYLFYILSFLLVLYSTYLTRSGDLQETSVHAFTDLGMNWQLRIFLLIFLIPAAAIYLYRYKRIPYIVKEESTSSREFWMFIGALVLFLSALAIIIPTSFPIINKIAGTNWAIGSDQEFAYNRVQVFVAIIIGVLTAVTQFYKYKAAESSREGKRILIPAVLSLVVALLMIFVGKIQYDKYGIGFLAAIYLALFASVYAVIANAAYLQQVLKGSMKAAGASITHIGFGLFLVGVLISSANKRVLSVNRINPVNFGADAKEKGEENLTLFQGIRTDMGDYWTTYAGDSSLQNGKFMYFKILMERKDGNSKFTLYPDLIKNTKGQEGYSNNPDAQHYLLKDIFAYISYADKMQEGEDTASFRTSSVKVGDTLFYSRGYMVLNKVGLNLPGSRKNFSANDTCVVADLTVVPFGQGKVQQAQPYIEVDNMQLRRVPDTLIAKGMVIAFNKINGDGTFEVAVKESSRLTPFVTLKVLEFPLINLVWLGTVIMIVGFIMSLRRRILLAKNG